jgi:hypothetical protein
MVPCAYVNDRVRTISLVQKLGWLIFVLFSTTPALPQMGHTYYLSPQGDDAWAGTSPQTAWQSLARANQHAFGPGDRLLLEAGATFRGSLTFDSARCGTQAEPVMVSSYGAGRATIAPDSSHAIWLKDCGGMVIERLILSGAGWAQTTHSGLVITSGAPASQARHRGLWIRQLHVSGFGGGGVSLYVEPGATGYREVVLEDIEATANGDHGIQLLGDYGAETISLRQVHIIRCLAHDNPGLPAKTWSHSGNGIVVGNADSVLIAHCEAHHNGANNAHRGGGPVGIWLWGCHHGLIEHCHSHHNQTGSEADGGGFDLDGGCMHCVMQYNDSHDNDGAGYLLAAFDGAPPLRHCTIRYNVSINDGRANQYGGITLWRGRAALDSIEIAHNTVVSQHNGRGRPAGFMVLSGGIQAVNVHHNLFLTGPEVPWLTVLRPVAELTLTNNAWVSLGKVGYGQWLGARFDASKVPSPLQDNWWGYWDAPADLAWRNLHQLPSLPWADVPADSLDGAGPLENVGAFGGEP